ncbi:MAG: enoyl-CoA hydratase/isomerase family protein [Deltaproteobacteria bacterium]|nr:enoyl-CoA hydratase/isomerase family protein [Deltaproteobacteria bacterium]
MTEYETLLMEQSGRVAVVRLHRPGAKNAMSVAMMRELIAVGERIGADLSIGAVVVTGSAEVFSGGVDLRDPELAAVFGLPLASKRRVLDAGPRLCRVWEELPQPTFAAVEGWCVGGGAALAMACDFRIVADGATIRIPEIERGMNFSWGSLPRIVSLVGPACAKKWVMFAESIDASEALRSGFAQWTCPRGEAERFAIDRARALCEMPLAAVMMTKQTVNAIGAAAKPVVHMDTDQFALTLGSEDFQEGVASFLEKRSPKFNQGLPEPESFDPDR